MLQRLVHELKRVHGLHQIVAGDRPFYYVEAPTPTFVLQLELYALQQVNYWLRAAGGPQKSGKGVNL